MAHFCAKTGVRIAGPGIVDSLEPEGLAPEHAKAERHPEVIEVDGVEKPVKKPKAEKPEPKADKPEAAPVAVEPKPAKGS